MQAREQGWDVQRAVVAFMADRTCAVLCEVEQGSWQEHGQLSDVLGAAHPLLLNKGHRHRHA